MAFNYSVVLDDPADLGGSQDAGLVADLQAAAADWSRYIAGLGTLVIQLDIAATAGGRAEGEPTIDAYVGTLDGHSLYLPSSIVELRAGQHVAGYSSDITITIDPSYLAELYVNPDPGDAGTVPADAVDAVSVFRHELAHGFGFGGLTTPEGSLGADETPFDLYIDKEADGSAYFTGPDAEAVYRGPVPLTTLPNGEGYAHLGNQPGDPLAQDLMNGVDFQAGTTYAISSLDVAILADVGVPLATPASADVPTPCFLAGTRILTLSGAMPVEALVPGIHVLTRTGRLAPVVWVGQRRVACDRHPHPERIRPVRVRAHAFAEGVPARDVLLSPDHAVLTDGVLIPVGRLLNGRSVAADPRPVAHYVHVELDRHDVVLAENLPVESYLDTGNRGQFGGASVSLHPDFASSGAGGTCAPFVLAGRAVTKIRQRLLARAARKEQAARQGARAQSA
ncbi:MAG: Hint domain-containing protein [Acidisphaera sp.]|nr:Hint domain-containing protein [Acidisphaera sp.]